MDNIAKMERAAMLAAVLGMVLGFIGSVLSDGTGRWKVIVITVAMAMVLFALFFIIIAIIKKETKAEDEKSPRHFVALSPLTRGVEEEAEEVIVPEEEPSPSASLTPLPKSEAREKFCFTNDRYDFLRGYGEVGEGGQN